MEGYDGVWTMFAPVKGKQIPVGLMMGYWPHPYSNNMILDRMAWFPWASARNRIEAAVNFLVKIRHEIPMIGFAEPQDSAFFIALVRHGMVRRIGKSYTVKPDVEATVYETRSG